MIERSIPMDDGMIVELFLKRDETAIAEAASKYAATAA